MDSSFENLPDLQREQLLDLIDRFTVQVVDGKGRYKGNAFFAGGHIISAYHVVDEDYVFTPPIGVGVSFEQVGSQDIARSVQVLGINGFKITENGGDGEEVFLVGRDQRDNPYLVPGRLETTGPIHRGKMEISVDRRQMNEMQKGMSGSAVINQEGEAIGVLVQARLGGKGLMEPFSMDFRSG